MNEPANALEDELKEMPGDAATAHLAPEPVSLRRRVLDVFRGATLFHEWVAWGLLAVGLIIIVLASLYIKKGVDADAQREFDVVCNEIRIQINVRLEAAAQILRSGAALFDASEEVSRGAWRTFARRLQFGEYLPGIQGLAYALLIPPDQLDQHMQAIRREGFPDYRVKPAGEREIYSAIIYIEPFEDRNLRAFGFDMLSEPVRRAAMERARDENTAALSGKVMLVQEKDQDVQAGGLMYVPVFRQGLPIETIEQRRAAIQGWVYSPYRMTDLMRGTLGHWHAGQKSHDINLQVYDGDVLSADTLLYDSQGDANGAWVSSAPITALTTVDFAGRHWTLRFTQPAGLVSLADYNSVWLVLIGGTMSILLLFGLTLWRQQRVRFYRDKAEGMAMLRASEIRYRRLFESAKDGILILDAETGMVADVNPFLIQLLGLSREEFIGKEIWELGFFNDIVANQESFAELQRQEYIRYEDKPLKTFDGRRIEVEFVSNVYLADHQKVIQCNIRDITERKLAEKSLLDVNAELQTALQELWKTQKQMVREARLSALGQMALGIAHDFNNALMPIAGYSEMILANPETLNNRDEALSMITDIHTAAKDASSIVKRLGLIRGSGYEGNHVPVDINEIVKSAVELVRPRWDKEMGAEGNTINIITRLKADKYTPGDASQLREAMINLILNAVDAMPKGGTLTISSRLKKDNVVVEVLDEGSGMTAETKECCLEPFFTTKGVKGTGLGLSMVMGIVTRHDGTLEIDSIPEKGTTIRIILPCVSTEHLANESKAEKAGKDFTITPLRILVADDEAQSRNVISLMLKNDGHTIEMTRTGREAIDKVNAGDFDLVITDRSMPEANGDLVALAVKARAPDMPVILLTGFGDLMEDKGECPPGVDRVLSKPLTRRDLREAIAKVLGHPSHGTMV